MLNDDNFIEYIGLTPAETINSTTYYIQNFVEGDLEFENLDDIDISRVYINVINDSMSILEEDINFYTILIDLNIEYIDNIKFGEVSVKNFILYKSLYIQNIEYIDLSLHNFIPYINIVKIGISKYYIYIDIISAYL